METILLAIVQLLESEDDAGKSVQRVLTRLRELVPYQQCAVLEAHLGQPPFVVTEPELPPVLLANLTETLLGSFGKFLAQAPTPTSNGGAAPPQSASTHLVLPLVSVDEVVGIIYVQSSEEQYTEKHVRLLSLVASQLAGYFTTVHTRAELAERVRERDEARRRAEAANRAKDEFLALVSHQLKTPLAAIGTSAHILRSVAADSVARAEAAATLEKGIETQTALIDEILTLADVATAKVRLNVRIIEPARLITRTIEALQLLAERRSVTIQSHIDTAVEPVAGDADRITQVLSTLLTRAIEFTPAGGRVEVRLDGTTGYARIQVKDSGSDIPPTALPHVFDYFRSGAEATAPSDPHVGVPLAIVKGLVELHGGRAHAETVTGEPGATFTVELPLARDAHEPAHLKVMSEQTSDLLLAGVRVLLVEHDEDIRTSFQIVLERFGAEVTALDRAPAALAILERSRPDVLLFGDLEMPDENAYDFMREVTARACPLQVASISARRFNEKDRVLAAGFRMHLSKPLELGTLVNSVAQLAGRTRSSAG